jgi:tRNA threonylcarbamoyladenosine biosynthesis protein TsaE
MNYIEIVESNCVEETRKAGKSLAHRLNPRDIVLLKGDLGAGKTEFIRGVFQYFHIEEHIKSPTFTIINYHEVKYLNHYIPIHHIDLYRIKNENEFKEAGLNEILFNENSIKLIEWADKFEFLFQYYSFVVDIEQYNENETKRLIKIYK